ncbi:hypothetical protein GCM10029964_083570 [Kibdelosporangium lantanae]
MALMAGFEIPRTDLLLTVMGAPHESDRTTTLLRLLHAVLERERSVQVWACGYATMLTRNALGDRKPRNVADWPAVYPTTAKVIGDLLAQHPDRLFWYGCRMCCDDRGADGQLPEVVLRPAARYPEHVAAAGRTVLMGVV